MTYSLQMNWPVDDVVTNIRHMLTLVKRATGNIKDAKDKDKDVTGRFLPSIVFFGLNLVEQ